MTVPVLEVRDLHVDVPTRRGLLHAVRGVSFTVSPGEALGLVGESGCGKSLSLRAVLDLLPHPAEIVGGQVFVDGVDVTALDRGARRKAISSAVSMVFQDPMTALNPMMRIGNQIAEAPQVCLGFSRPAARERALELMRQVGIPDPERRARAYPHELSGGLRQRVVIAIALSCAPKLLLCDEPTTALDVTIQAQVLELLRGLRRHSDLAMLLVTHDLAVVSETCDRLAVMYAGRIVEDGPIGQLVLDPQHPYTFSLLRSVPDPELVRQRLLTIAGSPPDLVEPVSGCPFAARCPFVEDDCTAGEPALMDLSTGRHSACRHVRSTAAWSAQVGVHA